MKGLLIKDFKLMLNQKQFLIVILCIGIFMSFTLQDASFVLGYIAFVFQMFTVSSISYDEFDNGFAFLLTLPFSRKTYVKEKYVFGLCLSLLGIFLGVVIAFVYLMMNQNLVEINQLMTMAVTYLPLLLLFISLMIPLQLKFGGDKGRIALVAVIGVIFIVGYLGYQLLNLLNFDLGSLLMKLETLNQGVLFILFCGVCLLVLLISMKISEKIMNSKEF